MVQPRAGSAPAGLEAERASGQPIRTGAALRDEKSKLIGAAYAESEDRALREIRAEVQTQRQGQALRAQEREPEEQGATKMTAKKITIHQPLPSRRRESRHRFIVAAPQ